MDPLADYAQSIILSKPLSLELLPSSSISSLVTFLLAIVLALSVFALLDRRRASSLARATTQRIGKINIPSQRQEKSSWLSKFRNTGIAEKRRIPLIAIIEVELIMTIGIVVLLGFFSSASVPPSVFPQFLGITVFGIIAFVFVMTLFAWFAALDTISVREYRKQLISTRKTAYMNTIIAYDDALASLKKASQPQTLEIRLDEFENRLRVLCDLGWDENVRSRIEAILEYVPDKFSDDSHVDRYVFWLKLIINSHGEETIPLIKEKSLIELEKMYKNPKIVKTDCDVLYILMELHGYDGEYLLEVVDDAAYRWGLVRFDELVSYISIGFAKLKSRSQEEYREFCNKLDEKMQKAEGRDAQAFERLQGLCKSARSILGT